MTQEDLARRVGGRREAIVNLEKGRVNPPLGLAWDIADTLNGLMAIPNLIAIFALSGVVFKTTKEFFQRDTLAK